MSSRLRIATSGPGNPTATDIESSAKPGPYPKWLRTIDGVKWDFASLPGISASADQIVCVSKGGNDATGDGTDEQPFLTIGAALTSIIDASLTKRYSILLAPGAYTENVALKPNTFIVGVQANICRIDGDVSLDGSWNSVLNNRGGLDNLVVVGNTVFDLVGLGAVNGFLFGQYAFFLGNFTVTADSASNFLSFQNAFFGNTVTLDGGQYELVMPICDNFTTFTIRGGANPTVVFLEGGACNGTGLVTSHPAQSAQVLNYGFVWSGSLTLDGLGSQIFAQEGDLPFNIGLSSGALAPVNAEVTLFFGFGSPIAINAGMNTFPLDLTSRGVLDDSWSIVPTLVDDNAELVTCIVTTAWTNGVGTLKVYNPGAGFNTANSFDVLAYARKVQ